MNSLDVLVHKVFLEPNRMKFGDLHNALMDYFDEHNIDYQKYHAVTDEEGSEISVMCMGIFSLLKLVSHVETAEKEMYLRQYIHAMSTLIRRTNFMEESHSLINYIQSFWKEEETSQELKAFSHALRTIRDRFGDAYHDDYMILLTLTTLAFHQTFPDTIEEFQEDWESHLAEMVELDTHYDLYSTGNVRQYITF